MSVAMKAITSVLWLIAFAPLTALANTRDIVGWVEKVRLQPSGIILHAKLDSGADYSSLNASDITQFEKDRSTWVRFSVTDPAGKSTVLEAPIRRFAYIKRHGGKRDQRPVIRLGLCVATAFMETDVNLVDRTNFDYQMLIGRSFLAGNVVVDAASTFTKDPECQGAVKK